MEVVLQFNRGHTKIGEHVLKKERVHPLNRNSFYGIYFSATAYLPLALVANCANACLSFTAKSASILRLTSIPATFKPCIKRL